MLRHFPCFGRAVAKMAHEIGVDRGLLEKVVARFSVPPDAAATRNKELLALLGLGEDGNRAESNRRPPKSAAWRVGSVATKPSGNE